MKKIITVLMLIPALALIVIVASCTKEGPTGPAGEDGIDGTATCGQCHDSGESFMAKVTQWEMSIHATGGNYARNSTSCAPCHTSMGFREIIETGESTTAADISQPTPINCYTCHKVHETYTSEDWELRYTDPVAFYEGGGMYDVGVSNMCAKCHQSRAASPYPDMGTGTMEVTENTSYRWGPHHGPQSNLFAGVGVSGAYEIAGDASYTNSYHTANLEKGCKTCHMAPPPYGGHAGGHQFSMGYNYHGHDLINTNGCLDCHEEGDEALQDYVGEKQAEIEDLMTELKGLLETNGIMDTVAHPGYMVVPDEGDPPIQYDNALAGAFYNYKVIEEDRSGGIHNFKYTKALLVNSIAALED